MSTYEVEVAEVAGELATETVNVVRMSRARFMEIVERELLLRVYGDELRARLLAVARVMPRYPFGAWIHRTRGCGCVVGEFLVQGLGADRRSLTHDYTSDTVVSQTVSAVYGEAAGDQAAAFGFSVDRALRDELALRLPEPAVILIEDGKGGEA